MAEIHIGYMYELPGDIVRYRLYTDSNINHINCWYIVDNNNRIQFDNIQRRHLERVLNQNQMMHIILSNLTVRFTDNPNPNRNPHPNTDPNNPVND